MACFLEAAIAHLHFLVNQRRAIGTCSTNLLERLFVEERQCLNIIPNGFAKGDLAGLSALW
ncbi:hypothetical protein NKI46_29740 [Mesorhizobium sp. M0615]|uniref:hypothetical protein n=1 Tax=Mesorhizobium sp. M0615 TaxID=2956971 RepID=UPI003338E7E3